MTAQRRYEVVLTEYRLDAGHVGEETGRTICWRWHNSKRAAGRSLASLIAGKHAKTIIAPRGMAYRYEVLDTTTGQRFSRTQCL